MRISKNPERLPDAAERKKISERAKHALTQAWALRDYLDQLESKLEVSVQETATRQGSRSKASPRSNQS
jgi:hypothetical protein